MTECNKETCSNPECGSICKTTPEKSYRYSEIFGNTIQGEGKYTGRPTSWIRFWGCQFNCNGFGQKDPTDPSTWNLDYQNVDVDKYSSLEELPVFKTGCDSSYSWSKKFSHLSHKDTAKDIVTKIEAVTPEGKFIHPVSKQPTHMAFTGGEPMMSQNAIVDIMNEFRVRNNEPKFITIETNTVTPIRDKFREKFTSDYDGELFWSCSPKLFLSGEPKAKALQPDILKTYYDVSDQGQLKYVCDGSDRAWAEVEEFTNEYRKRGINWEVYIMPVGATLEEQEDIQAKVAEGAIERGFNVAARLHCWIFGNVIGK